MALMTRDRNPALPFYPFTPSVEEQTRWTIMDGVWLRELVLSLEEVPDDAPRDT